MATNRAGDGILLRPSVTVAAVAAAAMLGLAAAPGNAIEALRLQIDRIVQGNLSARDFRLELAFPGARSGPATLRIAHATLAPVLGVVDDIRIDCAALVIREPQFSCASATVALRSSRFGRQRFDASVTWNGDAHALDVNARGLHVAGGSLQARATWSPRAWTLSVDAISLGIGDLRRLLGTQGPSSPLPDSWTLDGKLSALHATLAGAKTLQRVTVDATIDGVNLANPDGTTATDSLGSTLRIQAQRAGTAWRFAATVHSAHGEALTGRWYWNFGAQAMNADARGQWLADGTIMLDDGGMTLGRMLTARLAGRLTPGAAVLMPSTRLTLTDADFEALPPQTRDGVLAGTIVSQLQGRGHVSGSIDVSNDMPTAVDLELHDVALEDRKARLAIAGLDGRLRWNGLERSKQLLTAAGAAGGGPAGAAAELASRLRWRSGLLYGVDIGGAALQFIAASNDLRLTAPVTIPILDGGLAIKTLQLRHLGQPQIAIRFDAALEPISVPLLCKAFGWPEFAGKLSGRIPDLNLEAGVLTLGGALQAAVFDGAVRVSDLRLSDPFGARPRLQADMSFDRLDLAAVTGAFSFGKITGRISGHARQLELVGWEPVGFDAAIYSTPGDRSSRRISQEAVKNISSIGGGTGAAAALQRGALRFFKEFSYSKLGLSCKLANDVCEMQGVEPHAQGYYLVKGSGLPRIDVIGDSHRIDWLSLVASLKELPQSQISVGKPP